VIRPRAPVALAPPPSGGKVRDRPADAGLNHQGKTARLNHSQRYGVRARRAHSRASPSVRKGQRNRLVSEPGNPNDSHPPTPPGRPSGAPVPRRQSFQQFRGVPRAVAGLASRVLCWRDSVGVVVLRAVLAISTLPARVPDLARPGIQPPAGLGSAGRVRARRAAHRAATRLAPAGLIALGPPIDDCGKWRPPTLSRRCAPS